jgi:hypothetical protein
MRERALALELEISRVAQVSAPGNHPGYASVHASCHNSNRKNMREISLHMTRCIKVSYYALYYSRADLSI